MSYFHEYFLDRNGRKTMIDYSDAFDVIRRCGTRWLTDEQDVWYVAERLDDSRHRRVMPPAARRTLRPADPVEIAAGRLTVFAEQ
jgi:hypothetical protein